MSVYDIDAFSERVAYAKKCLLSGGTHGRGSFTCFEMGDADYVMIRLWQDARKNPQLAKALQGYGSTVSQYLYLLHGQKSARQIGNLARIERARKAKQNETTLQ